MQKALFIFITSPERGEVSFQHEAKPNVRKPGEGLSIFFFYVLSCADKRLASGGRRAGVGLREQDKQSP